MRDAVRKCLVPLWIVISSSVLALHAHAASDGARIVMWDELVPKDWQMENPLADLSDEELNDLLHNPEQFALLEDQYLKARSSAPVVGELDGQSVRMPGYVVPLDFEGTEISEFLLVPYIGACIHVPPPPSNQIVFVKTKDTHPLEGLFEPVWVTGELSTQSYMNDVGDAGYTLQAVKVEPYKPIVPD